MTGKLYGVGTGPGDPELLTLKAVRIIENCPVIAVPGENPELTVAYQIVKKAGLKGLEEKEWVGIFMPMTKDKEKLAEAHRKGIGELKQRLDQGKEVAFLTLGDPTIYSTYMYLHQEIRQLGYQTEIVSGIPSFCAAAAAVGMDIGKEAEQVHLIPASYPIESALNLPGTKILMKSGREYLKVKVLLEAAVDVEGKRQVWMVENCGMDTEVIYDGMENLPEKAGYYTLIFIKDGV